MGTKETQARKRDKEKEFEPVNCRIKSDSGVKMDSAQNCTRLKSQPGKNKLHQQREADKGRRRQLRELESQFSTIGQIGQKRIN